MNISFKRLGKSDLPVLFKWLNTPHVIEWYSKKQPTFGEVEKKYLPRITGVDPTKSYIFSIDTQQVGYIQSYRIKDNQQLVEYVVCQVPLF